MSGDWELRVNWTEAKLVRAVAGEKVTVTFNGNDSIPLAADAGEEVDNTFEDELVELSIAQGSQSTFIFWGTSKVLSRASRADKTPNTLTLWQTLASEQNPL